MEQYGGPPMKPEMLLQLCDIHCLEPDMTVELFERVTLPYLKMLLEDLVLDEQIRLIYYGNWLHGKMEGSQQLLTLVKDLCLYRIS